MNEALVRPPVTLNTHGVFHPNGRYHLEQMKKNIIVAVEDRTGKPMDYPVTAMQPISLPIESMVGSYVFNWLNRVVSEANHIPEWKAIDDYHGKGPKKREFNGQMAGFVLNLLKHKFEPNKDQPSRSESAQYLWNSGLTPEILDHVHAFMFPPPPATQA